MNKGLMEQMAYSQGQKKTFFADPILNSAILFAIVVHLVPIFGLTFHNQTSPTKMIQDVADVLANDSKNKKDADFIAASNQQGSGKGKEAKRLENSEVSPIQSEIPRPKEDWENREKSQTAQNYMQDYLHTTISIQEIEQVDDKKKKEENNNKAEDEQDRIQAQIATLEAKVLSRRNRIKAKSTKIKNLTSAVDTQKSADAQYINRFRKKVEHIGNKHYPKQARARNLKGDVRLQVIIKSNGEIGAIVMKKSSGSSVLDEFAKATVRQAAPYGKFSKDMDYTEVRLIRTWRFTDADTVETFSK